MRLIKGKTKLIMAHNYKWYGLKAYDDVYSSLKYQGIAVRCKNFEDFEFECYAPDPDDEDYCIRFVISEIQIIQAVRAQKDLAMFLLENGFFFEDFAKMGIAEKLYYICQRYDIIALLTLNNPPSYLREEIKLINN